jgi:hypothetical protein
MANKQISYTTRDFQNIRQELINFTKTYYPDLVANFNDAAIFSVFMDLNAAVTDNLHYHIDRSIQETVLQYAQQRSSIYNIARTYGLKIPGQRPSVAICEFSITVPAFGDKEDLRYCGILRRGSQVQGAGQIFETIYDIDFASDFGSDGTVNRLVIPNYNQNNILVNYTIVKREPVVNGVTKVFRKTISNAESRPFYEIFLPERNVLGVTGVLLKDGVNYTNVPTAQEFLGLANRWYEVQALAEDRIFIEDPTKTSDTPGVKVGRYLQTATRFITEYTPEGFFKITFGGGNTSTDELLREFARTGNPLDLSKYQNNFSLGSVLKPNSTLFVQYRIGGGLGSNLGVNVLNNLGTISFNVNGPSQTINTSVINSLSCTNTTAAIGGANIPTTEEVRNYVTFNFSAQNRAVTINDYEAIIRKMPSQFGAPAKVTITEEDNKMIVNVLSYDSNGKLTAEVSETLKTNIANYISNYRMINDYVVIATADVVDLLFDISLVLDATQNQGVVISNAIVKISEYMSPEAREMGQNVNVSEIRRILQSEDGVISVADISVFNLVGGKYSSSETSQRYSDPLTKKIELIDDTIFAEPKQIYQTRFPNSDIKIRVKNLSTVNFS